MNNIFITIKKELQSIFRDKKTLPTLFILPLFIPIFVMLYGIIYDAEIDTTNDNSEVGINIEVDEFSALSVIADECNIELIYSENYQDYDVYIEYVDDIYYIYADINDTDGQIIETKVELLLDTYNEYLGKTYLRENNIDIDKVYSNIEYELVTTDSQNILVKIILELAIVYTIMSIMVVSNTMAVSATATEKENGTLETILTLPISSSELIIGKHAAASIMGIILSLFSFIISAVSLFIASNTFEIYNELNINFNIVTILISILILVCASIFISGLSISLTALAKSTKEAQSKLQLMQFLPLIPMFISLLEVNTDNIIYYLIPVCNFTQILIDIFTNNINILYITVTCLSTLIYIIIVIYIIIKQYNSEKVLFAN